jgi:hypothetical protein
MVRVRIDYLDQNEDFAQYLPVTGEVTRPLVGADGRRWWVIGLDHPLEYQRRVAQPLTARFLVEVAEILGRISG